MESHRDQGKTCQGVGFRHKGNDAGRIPLFRVCIGFRPCFRASHLLKDDHVTRLKGENRVIFKGEDYRPGACTAIDSLKSVYGLLSFLAVGRGDTDEDFFKDYTPEQIAWRDGRKTGARAGRLFQRGA